MLVTVGGMFRPTYLVYAASLVLAGCNFAAKEEAQHDDSSNPHYKMAQENIDNNNPVAAVADYEAALAENPKLAGAHYSLGLLYGDKLNDPVGSIFHFKRYLELEPNSDKAAQVQGLIEKESQAFAASLPSGSAPADSSSAQTEIAALKKQVDDATRTIARLQAQLAQGGGHRHGRLLAATATAPIIPVSADASETAAATNAPAATNSAPVRATAVDTNAPDVNAPMPPAAGTTNAPASTTPGRSYTVVKGDSIWKIAKKMYPGDTKNGEDKILGANPGLDPKKLKIGQVLVVP